MDPKINQSFVTTKKYSDIKEESFAGPNGWLLFAACNSGVELAKSIKAEYEKYLDKLGNCNVDIPIIGANGEPMTRVFSDTESCPRLPIHVAGANAYVFQCVHENISGNTVNENIQQLLQVIRTLRSHRARTVTVVLPYTPYSRQDKPSFMKRETALASLFADQLRIAGADLFLTYHPHTLSLYGFYEPQIKFVALSGLDLFQNVFKEFKNRDDVIVVSTDAGGAKTTIHFAEALGVSYAISSKYRQDNGTSMLGVVGDFSNKKIAIVSDDETVTGGSILSAVKSLYLEKNIKEIYVAVTHFKITATYLKGFIEAHEKYGLKEVHITDTIPQKKDILNVPFIKQHKLASILASTINKLHYNQSVSEIFSRL